MYVLLVGGVKITFRKAQIIDRVEYVCLAHTVIPGKSYHFFRELKVDIGVVFKIKKCKFT